MAVARAVLSGSCESSSESLIVGPRGKRDRRGARHRHAAPVVPKNHWTSGNVRGHPCTDCGGHEGRRSRCPLWRQSVVRSGYRRPGEPRTRTARPVRPRRVSSRSGDGGTGNVASRASSGSLLTAAAREKMFSGGMLNNSASRRVVQNTMTSTIRMLKAIGLPSFAALPGQESRGDQLGGGCRTRATLVS